jgi:hypothetical protein
VTFNNKKIHNVYKIIKLTGSHTTKKTYWIALAQARGTAHRKFAKNPFSIPESSISPPLSAFSPVVSSQTPSSSYQAGGGAAIRLQLAGEGAMPPKSDSVEGKSPLFPNPNQNDFGSKPSPILIVLSSLDQSSDNRCAPVSLLVSLAGIVLGFVNEVRAQRENPFPKP